MTEYPGSADILVARGEVLRLSGLNEFGPRELGRCEKLLQEPTVKCLNRTGASVLAASTTVLSSAVDRDLKGCADGAHLGVGKAAKPTDQHCDRDTFDGVEVYRRTAGDRVGTGFENNLAGESPDGGGTWCDECASKPRDRRVAREHNDWAAADLGHPAPPHLTACRKRTHEAPAAARRHDARSPHSSGSSAGWSS
jgi:hypothetical protein